MRIEAKNRGIERTSVCIFSCLLLIIGSHRLQELTEQFTSSDDVFLWYYE